MSNQVATSLDYHVGLAIPASLRFHPRLKHRSGVYLPAMVAAIEYLDGAIVGVHRTFLKPDGTGKADVEPRERWRSGGGYRLRGPSNGRRSPSWSLVRGNRDRACNPASDREVHVWCALGTSNLRRVELPGFVREVIVAADHDDAGIEGRARCG